MTTSLNKTDSNTNPKYFDVWIETLHGNQVVHQANRIKAENEDDAITEAFINNSRNLSEDEVRSIIFKQRREQRSAFITVDDNDEFIYRLDCVIELEPITVKHNGNDIAVFVPRHNKDFALYNERYAHGMVGR